MKALHRHLHHLARLLQRLRAYRQHYRLPVDDYDQMRNAVYLHQLFHLAQAPDPVAAFYAPDLGGGF